MERSGGIGMKAVINVVGKDRIGIIADVAMALKVAHVNIDDINQTIMQGVFTMTMLVDLNQMNGSFEALQRIMTECGEKLELSIKVQRADVFTAMHQV